MNLANNLDVYDLWNSYAIQIIENIVPNGISAQRDALIFNEVFDNRSADVAVEFIILISLHNTIMN